MAGDILGLGVSGLLAYQRALATAGHNIANVNTEGYSRQRTEFSARQPQFFGFGYMGAGVQVDAIRRISDAFVVAEIRSTTSSQSEFNTFYQMASQVDNLLSDANTGLIPGIDAFFNAVQSVANEPASANARQVLLSEAVTLDSRFNYIDKRLFDLSTNTNSQIQNAVREINTLAASIADLNKQIVLATQGSSQPNDLLDRRDVIIRQLAEKISVSTVPQDDGAVNVFVGNGQSLVIGNQAQQLSVIPSQLDPTELEVAYGTGAGAVNITRQISGGELGGLLDFRDQVLNPARNALGRVAIALSDGLNAQHQLGMDLNGALGGLFFSDIAQTSPEVFSTSAQTLTVTVSDANALTLSDYRLDYDGANYTLTRLSDNVAVASFAALPQTIASEGLTLNITGAPAAGDSFLILPTRAAARNFGVQITNTEEIAAAAPIRAEASLANLGDADITPGTVNTPPPPDPNLTQTVTLTFNNPPTDFDVAGVGTGNPAGVAYTSGGNITYNGWTLQVSGNPQPGDVFTISINTAGVSDNRNALLLGDLQNRQNMVNSSATFGGAYGQLVTKVGAQTHAADINSAAQSILLAQAEARRESVSGVNLDEEAANLVRYQQAYEASAQVIAMASMLFDVLLSAVRR